MHDQASHMRAIASGHGRALRPAHPRVITVTSGKGGVGKSTVALNMGIVMAEMGKQVLLIDADANLANLDIMLGVSPRFRLSNVLRGEVDLEDILISPQQGLRVLPGSSGEVDYPLLNAEMQEDIIGQAMGLDDRPDIVLIDTSAGLSPEIIGFALHSTEVIVVSSVEPTSIMDAYAVMKVITASEPDRPISLLLNSVRLPSEAEETVRKLRLAVDRFLKRDIGYLGFVPFDVAVQKAVQRQEPFVRVFPRSAAALSLTAMTRQWVQEMWNGSYRRAAS